MKQQIPLKFLKSIKIAPSFIIIARGHVEIQPMTWNFEPPFLSLWSADEIFTKRAEASQGTQRPVVKFRGEIPFFLYANEHWAWCDRTVQGSPHEAISITDSQKGGFEGCFKW